MALSKACCQKLAPWLSAGASSAARRCSKASGNATSQRASNSRGMEMENSSEASMVSGVPGSNLWRRRSDSSVIMAVRGANPKSASSVVMSTRSIKTSHHACKRWRSSLLLSIACTKASTRPTATSTEGSAAPIHSSTWISQRWRSASSASGFNSASRRGRSWAFLGIQCNVGEVGWGMASALSPVWSASSTNSAIGASKVSPSSLTHT